MRKFLNHEPFIHHSHNGVKFKAARCDFVGGVTAIIPAGLSLVEAMEDAVEMGGWHQANIVPSLNGFTGPAKITIQYSTEDENQAILQTPLLTFFSVEALEALSTFNTARRLYKALEIEQRDMARASTPVLINTVGDFLEYYTLGKLKKAPRLGPSSSELIVRRLKADGLNLRRE